VRNLIRRQAREKSERASFTRSRSRPGASSTSEVDEQADGDGLSLEDLVTRVFVLLTVFVVGFALSWYFFPRVLVMPVPIDPRTGLPIDPSTGQVYDPRDPNTQRVAPSQAGAATSNSGTSTPRGSDQPSSSGQGGQQKGNNAKPR